MESGFLEMLATIAPIIIIVLLLLLLLAIGYVKASPDTAYIISGLRKQPKVLIGKAGIKILKAMPEIAKNITEPLAKVDKITMYGDGNSSKLVKDIVGTLTQVTDGLKESTGVDLQSVLSGFLGAKLLDTKKPEEGANDTNGETSH